MWSDVDDYDHSLNLCRGYIVELPTIKQAQSQGCLTARRRRRNQKVIRITW